MGLLPVPAESPELIRSLEEPPAVQLIKSLSLGMRTTVSFI